MTDIIIVSYKDEIDLKRCIESVRKYCKNYNLMVENNNPPNANVGYTAAVNAGIRKGKSEFIWLLNSDAIVKDEMSQQALIERCFYGSQVGIAGSMQIDPLDPDRISHCGTLSCLPGVHKNGRISKGDGRFPEKQTWVNFASVLLKRSMIDKIGPLDPRFFLICSDSDYCYYARSKSYEVWYEPRSQVYHVLRASKAGSEWHQKDVVAFMKKWGIQMDPDGKKFYFSREFDRLNRLP
jgi:GT2 family glycosyltransferase